MKNIKKGALQRRLTVGVAGVRGGVGLLSSRASGLLLPKEKQQAHNNLALEREANRFVKQLGNLKGAYVKIGQMLALYGEHLLPRPVTTALHSLEAQTTPFEWEAIRPMVLHALGEDKLSDISINPEPLAAASLAQAHTASIDTLGGAPCCIKIQYPGIANTIEDDFRNVMQMLALTRWVKSGRQLQVFAEDLKAKLLLEVDYRYERNTANKVATLLNGDLRFLVPSYYQDYSTDTVLLMDYVEGFDVTHAKVQKLSQVRRNKLANAMLELFFKEAFEWGLMQTDPNFGNYRILIDQNGVNDRIALLDFGAVHKLQKPFAKALKETILAAHFGDQDKTISGLIEMNCLRTTDTQSVKASFAQFCSLILEPFSTDMASIPGYAKSKDGTYDWHASKLLKRAGKRGSEMMFVKGFSVPPPEFMLMVRKLTGVFTFVSALRAKTNSGGLLERYSI